VVGRALIAATSGVARGVVAVRGTIAAGRLARFLGVSSGEVASITRIAPWPPFSLAMRGAILPILASRCVVAALRVCG
jgi:hypothetical protein